MNKPLSICICGGGHLAHALVSTLGAHPAVDVRLLTRRPADWSKTVEAHCLDDYLLLGRARVISSDPSEVIPGADVVLLAVPAFARTDVLKKIYPQINRDALVGSIPGTAGFDWITRRILGGGVTVFGVQRAPYVCRILEYGRSVQISGIRPCIYLGAIPCTESPWISRLMQQALGLPVVPLPNYLAVTLTPGNSFFHSSRLYSLFRGWGRDTVFSKEILFYEEWDDYATKMYCAFDREIQDITHNIPVDLTCVIPAMKHYRVKTPLEMTRTIRSIRALKGLKVPLRATADGYVPDFEHRFFTEDIYHGLVSVRGIASLAGVRTPAIDKVLRWAGRLVGRRFIRGGRLLASENPDLPIPENFGIHTREELVSRATY